MDYMTQLFYAIFIPFILLSIIIVAIVLAVVFFPQILAFISNKNLSTQAKKPQLQPVPVRQQPVETPEQRRIRLIHEEEENQICEMRDRQGNLLYRTTADKFWGYRTDWSNRFPKRERSHEYTEEELEIMQTNMETEAMRAEATAARDEAERAKSEAWHAQMEAEYEQDMALADELILAGLLL